MPELLVQILRSRPLRGLSRQGCFLQSLMFRDQHPLPKTGFYSLPKTEFSSGSLRPSLRLPSLHRGPFATGAQGAEEEAKEHDAVTSSEEAEPQELLMKRPAASEVAGDGEPDLSDEA